MDTSKRRFYNVYKGQFSPYAIILLSLVVAILFACATNPYTERSQLLLLPESYEIDLGTQAFQQIVKDPQVQVSDNPAETEPVQRVAARIIEAAKSSKYADRAQQFEWEVLVIKDDRTLNAFALPGGKIAFYTGIFPIAKNEAGLAAIMGHEVVHALARHGAERMGQGLVAQIALDAVALTLQGPQASVQRSRAIMQALGLGAQVGILLPFSRKHESEADYIGLLLAAQAGYDPREAVRVWERMEAAGGEQPPEFLSSHPSHGRRIQQLQSWMPEALTNYEQAVSVPAADLPPLR